MVAGAYSRQRLSVMQRSRTMPAQLPAGGPGAEAPREQPASPTTDDAPPPVKQEYTGAQGAEIAGSADSASAGPGASDSLCRSESMAANFSGMFEKNSRFGPSPALLRPLPGDDATLAMLTTLNPNSLLKV